MVDHHHQPVQTSAVYLLNRTATCPADPPPSPPSLVTPDGSDVCSPFTDLSLDFRIPPGFAPPVMALNAEKSPQPEDANAPTPGVSALGLLADSNADRDTKRDQVTTTRLSRAVHVLATEAAALHGVAHLYRASAVARAAFSVAASAIVRATAPAQSGKLVISGVGKSGIIARKLVATFTSLSVPALFLHPTEALHGDLGIVTARDVLLLVSFSGATPELIALLPNVHRGVRTVLITGQMHARETGGASCPLVAMRPDMVVLPAPVLESETVSFGVAAPMTSTTVAMALGDALALVVAEERCQNAGSASRALSPARLAEVFRRNHPGGAIGAAAVVASLEAGSSPPSRSLAIRPVRMVRNLAIPWSEIAMVESCIDHRPDGSLSAADVLRAAYMSSVGWARSADGMVYAPSHVRRLRSADLSLPVNELPWLGKRREDLIAMAGEISTRDAWQWISSLQRQDEDDNPSGAGEMEHLIAVLEGGEIYGVLEGSQLSAD